MRIVGGKLKSRKLEFFDDSLVRPTRDMVREGVFNALGDISNRVVLDLFAGTGAFGLESISRGATKAYFVDNYIKSIKAIKSNIKNLCVESCSEVLNFDYKKALQNLKSRGIKFSLVFLDPPYKLKVYEEIIRYLIDNEMLEEDSIIVTESDIKLEYDFVFFNNVRDYKYRDNYVSIYRSR